MLVPATLGESFRSFFDAVDSFFGNLAEVHLGSLVLALVLFLWRITDALGRVIEVRGAGVVGEQPRLSPGESFKDTSGTPLDTPSGIMVGTYQMVTEGGEVFDVKIPAFSLDAPGMRGAVN